MLRWVYCWGKKEEGSTAVEFALVAVPFLFLLLGIIEISLMFVAGANLNSGTSDAARLIRTGQAQQAPGGAEGVFRDRLCERVDVFLSCSQLQYEVIPMDNFSDYSLYQAIYDEDGNLDSQGFDAGGSSDVVLIRVSYRYPLILPMIGNIFADGPRMTKHLLSTVVLQNEPYDIQQEMENM
jgi:Flp pilus assembly protein TadG